MKNKRTNGGRQYDFEQEAPNTSASSNPYVALEHPMRRETPSRPGSVLVQKLCHVEDDEHISALDVFHEKDERENREVLEWYRGEDAGDLERSELNELVENWRYVSDPGRRNWKINEKSWKTWRGNQKMVMDEDKVQNGVMDEKFVKNFVMGAKIDPKVVMDLSVFKIGGWNILQSSNRKLSEEFINENEPRLSIRIPSRDSCFMIQYLEQPFVCDNLNVKDRSQFVKTFMR